MSRDTYDEVVRSRDNAMDLEGEVDGGLKESEPNQFDTGYLADEPMSEDMLWEI